MKRILFVLTALLSAAPSFSQYGQESGTTYPIGANRLQVPFGFIDTGTGNMSLDFPIYSLPNAREIGGSATHLRYNSNIWYRTPFNAYSPYLAAPKPGWTLANEYNPTSTYAQAMNEQIVSCPAPWHGNYEHASQWTSIDPNGTKHYFFTGELFHYDCTDSQGNPTGYQNPSSATVQSGDGYTLNIVNYYTRSVYDPKGTSFVTPNGNLSYTVDSAGYQTDNLGGHLLSLDDPGCIDGSAGFIWTETPYSPKASHTCNWTMPAFNGASQTLSYSITWKYIPVCTSIVLHPGNGAGESDYCGGFWVVGALTIPTGSYTFEYDEGTSAGHYGQLTSITLPTGGVYQYTYNPPQYNYPFFNQFVHTLTADGGQTKLDYTPYIFSDYYVLYVNLSDEEQRDHSYPVTVTYPARAEAPPATSTVMDMSVFNLAQSSESQLETSGTLIRTDYSGSSAVRKYERDYYPPQPPSYEQTTWLETSDSRRADYSYSQGLLTQKIESVNGVAYRKTKTAYITDSATVAYNSAFFMSDYPTLVQVTDAADHVLSQTEITYDEYDAGYCSVGPPGKSGVQGLSLVSGATGHNDFMQLNRVARGNPTTIVRRSLVTGDPDIVEHRCYDTLGNVTQTVDGNGHASQFSYADNFSDMACVAQSSGSYAFQTSSTNAMGHTTVSQYGSCVRQATRITDPNDAANSRSGLQNDFYADGRLQCRRYADGGSTCNVYTANSTTETVLDGPSRETLLDPYGRVRLTRDVATNVGVETKYDLTGRTVSVSNPGVVSVGGGGQMTVSTPVTATYHDGLGRTTYTQQPDGAGTSVAYNGLSYTTVDSTGNGTWTRTLDPLGRLVSVLEPTALTTSYSYNELDALTKVSQLGNSASTCGSNCDLPRVRSFKYDALSRLITSTNPETGTICYGQWSNGNCLGGYDANGNLLYKTDANGMTVSYLYDALNRLQSKTAPDAGNTNFYYTYDASINGIGRLTGESNPNGTAGTTYTYDPMCRIKSTQWFHYTQQAWQPGIQDVEYNLAGNITQITYPDGRTVSQSFDGAGRLSGVADGPANSPGASYFKNPQYWPSGTLQSATYGNDVTETIVLNSRLQPCHTFASTSLLPTNTNGGNLYDRASFYSDGPEPNCGSAPGNNGNIHSVVDYRNPGWSQSFGYDSLNRLTSAWRSDGGYHHTYTYPDSFGNMVPVDNLYTPMNYGIDAATNRMTLNGDLNTGDLRYYPNGQLAVAPNGLGGSHNLWYTAEGYLRSIDNYGTGSYLYNGSGERTLAVRNNQTATEYVYLNGQPMATYEATTGVWTDYIYANGRKIAKVDQQKPVLHLQGYHANNSYGVEGPVNGVPAGVTGYTIQSGDRLSFSMFQNVPTYGGLALIFTTADSSGDQGSGGTTDSTTGTPLYVNGTNVGQWQSLSGDLSAYAGRTISYVLGGIHQATPVGNFDLYLTDAAIQTADGRTLPILTGQAASVTNFAPNNWTGQYLNSGVEMNAVLSSKINTNYYLADHLGTTQMELSGGGWPLWQGQFTPFGQEIINGTTNNILGQQSADGTAMPFKFTGKERDTESGLDYFGARYYGSSMGRFTSPDFQDDDTDPEPVPWANYTNPQSLNLYSYVFNNPVSRSDPDGHDCIDTSNFSKDGTVTVTRGDSCANNLGPNGTYVNGTIDTKSITASVGASGTSFGYNFTSYDGQSGGSGVIAQSAPYGPLQGPANQAGVAHIGAFEKPVNIAGGIEMTLLGIAMPTLLADTLPEVAGMSGVGRSGASVANKLNHIFGKSQHNLDGVVQACGGRLQAYEAMQNAAAAATRGTSGPFEVTVQVGGQNVVVRGTVIDGAVKIGTAFRP